MKIYMCLIGVCPNFRQRVTRNRDHNAGKGPRCAKCRTKLTDMEPSYHPRSCWPSLNGDS